MTETFDLVPQQIDKFMASLRRQENGGSYDVTPNVAGAKGAYQIVDWNGWAREAGMPGAAMTPANQDAVARFKIMQYYNKYNGNLGAVAAAWYGGERTGDAYARGGDAAVANYRHDNGPSIPDYVHSVLNGGGVPSSGGGVGGPSTGGAGGSGWTPSQQDIAQVQGNLGDPAYHALTREQYIEYAKNTAKSLFPTLSSVIDSGVTVKQYADPYLEQASQTLEIPKESIDLRDPKYRKFLDRVGPDGKHSAMALWEVQDLIKQDPVYGYDHTIGAQKEAADFTTQLLKTFGKIGS